MHILIVGAGLMGPAAAYHVLNDPAFTRVTLADASRDKLGKAARSLEATCDIERLHTIELDLSDATSTRQAMEKSDVILAALPWTAVVLAANAAIDAGTPLIDIAIPDDDDIELLRTEAEQKGGRLLVGCGLEPGITEIETVRLADALESIHSFHIMVGGIPTEPTGPLGYKIVFGGDALPLRTVDALVVEDGSRRLVPRYSGVRHHAFADAGIVEAWNEGVIPWLLDHESVGSVSSGLQQTIRWPGYADKATFLNDSGLLANDPIDVNGQSVVPKDVVDAVLKPYVTMTEDDRDLTLLRVEVEGEYEGNTVVRRSEMVDRYDESIGMTSMARTTARTAAVIAKLVATEKIEVTGLTTPDRLITGDSYDMFAKELNDFGLHFRTITYDSRLKACLNPDGRISADAVHGDLRSLVLDFCANSVSFDAPFTVEELNSRLENIVEEVAVASVSTALQNLESFPKCDQLR